MGAPRIHPLNTNNHTTMILKYGTMASAVIISNDGRPYGFVKVEQDLSATVFRMTGPEMDEFAAILTAEAARLRKLEDDSLNTRIAEQEANTPAQ